MFNIFKRQAARESPTNAKAIACFQRGDFAGALREVDAIIEQVPHVAMSHRFRGEVLFSLDRFDDAICAFEAAETIGGPGTEEVFFWKALAYANSGRTRKAFSILDEYIGSSTANPDLIQKCKAAMDAIRSQAPQG